MVEPDRTRSAPTTGEASTPAPDPPDPARRRQRAGFSVFFDEPASGGRVLETRIYHEESGLEVVFPDAEPGRWAEWMLDRIRGAEAERAPGETRRVHLTLRVGVSGIGDVERELGRAMLDALAQLRAAPERPPDLDRTVGRAEQ